MGVLNLSKPYAHFALYFIRLAGYDNIDIDIFSIDDLNTSRYIWFIFPKSL